MLVFGGSMPSVRGELITSQGTVAKIDTAPQALELGNEQLILVRVHRHILQQSRK